MVEITSLLSAISVLIVSLGVVLILIKISAFIDVLSGKISGNSTAGKPGDKEEKIESKK